MRAVAWILVALMLIGAAGSASASVTVLTFEGMQDLEPILNYYNGGLGGLGSGPGPNYGITFGADSLALNSGNYSNNPSPPGTAFFLTGPGDIMNVLGGFDTGFSFFYSAAGIPGSVTVYDGFDGTGTILATLFLPVTPTLPPFDTDFNNWQPIGVAFAGIAKSVNFSGVANQIGFDNITLGSETPSGSVPEPTTIVIWSLLGGCALGLGWMRTRKAG
jgi:hypothetical protein